MPSNAVICRAFTGCGTLQCGSPGSSETRTTEERRMGEPSVGARTSEKPVVDRLDSWKEIAAYLNRDVTTVQRWEKREGMPVYRHLHDRMGSVYASRVELDDWTFSRNLGAAQGNARDAGAIDLLGAMEISPGGGHCGGCCGDCGRSLATEDGVLLAKSYRQRALPDGHRLRRNGTSRCGVARRTFRSVPVGPGRTDGRLGDTGGLGTVPQPDPRRRAGTGQSFGADAGLLS